MNIPMSRHPGLVELRLSFSLVRCLCGATRQAGLTCQECGCAPEEVDEGLERRRQIVEAVDAGSISADEQTPQLLGDLWSDISSWLGQFTDAYEQTGDGAVNDAAARLRDALIALAVLRAQIAIAPRHRPFLAHWRAAERILDLHENLVAHYTGAFIASTPEEAEREAAEGQVALDAAAEIINRFNAVNDERAALDEVDPGDEYADLIVGARGAFNLADAENLIDLETKGASLYERVTGRSDCPVGFGIRLQMLNLIVESTFDEERFWAAARSVHDAVLGRREPFSLLVRDSQWRGEFVEVAREARDAGLEASAIATGALNRRRDIRSGIRLGAVITERLAPPLVATLLTLLHRATYARERAKDVSTLLRELKAAGLSDLVAGIDLAVRDADAHNKFVVTDKGVEFTSTRREYDFLTDGELLDRIVMGFESTSALHIGIAAALPVVGVEHEELDALVDDRPTDEEGVRIVLALNGWTDIELDRDGTTLRIRGRRAVETPVGVAATFAQFLDDIDELILEGEGIGPRRVARGPAEPFRRAARSTDPHEKHLATIESLASWTIDGRRPLASTSLRKVIAHEALQALLSGTPQDEAVSWLDALHSLAERLDARGLMTQRNDRRLKDALAGAVIFLNRRSAGASNRVEAERVVAALNRLMPETVPELRHTW